MRQSVLASTAFIIGIATHPGCAQSGQNAVPGTIFTGGSVAVAPITSVGVGENTQIKTSIASVPDKQEQRVNRVWYTSIAMMLAGNTADAATSWHKQEQNALLASGNGTFGEKAVGIKIGVTAALVVPQILLRHHTEFRKPFIVGNLIDAALFGGTAIHNAGIKQ